MSESSAKVDSIDAIKNFKIALIKFAETGMIALAAAEGEATRVQLWLQLEQPAYWKAQLRKRQEELTRANEAYRAKAMFKDSTGRSPDASQELKAVQIAKRRIEEAEWKITAIKRNKLRLDKELQNFKGGVQRLSADVTTEIPRAAERLERIYAKLDSYVALAAPDSAAPVSTLSSGESSSGLRDDQASMKRATDELPGTEDAATKPGEVPTGEQS
jgi:hypothetical protein